MALINAEPYPFDLDPTQAALIIIDMQRDFLDPGGFGAALGNDVSLLWRTIAPCRQLLAQARLAGLTVIHTREGHRHDLADLPPTKKARGRLPVTIGDPGPMGRILVRARTAMTSSPNSIRCPVSRSSTSPARAPFMPPILIRC